MNNSEQKEKDTYTREDENERQQGKMRMKGGNHRTSTKADSKVAD